MTKHNAIAPKILWQSMPRPPDNSHPEHLMMIMAIMRVEIIRMTEALEKAGVTIVSEPDESDDVLGQLREGLEVVMLRMLFEHLGAVVIAVKDLPPDPDFIKAKTMLEELLNKVKKP